MSKLGRKPKSYITSWGEVIPGLARGKDSRWRIIKTGERFTEADERRAVNKFLRLKKQEIPETIEIRLPYPESQPKKLLKENPIWSTGGEALDLALQPTGFSGNVDGTEKEAIYRLNKIYLLHYIKEYILSDPDLAAKELGIPELNRLGLTKTEQSISLTAILDAYKQLHSQKEQHSLGARVAAFKKFIGFTRCQTLADVTLDRVKAYRDSLEASDIQGSTEMFYFNCVKSIIASGMKTGFNPKPLREVLDILKNLHTKKRRSLYQPEPISRENFQKLLATANPPWKAILLISLNCCLHLGETINVKWESIDIDRATYSTYREKTREKRIPQCACLWKETIEAIQAIRKPTPYLFISTHGKRYNRQTAGNLFSELRIRAEVPSSVKADGIRDGGLSAAVRAKVDNRIVSTLAGHAQGIDSHYVLMNPESVKPATDAIYQYYFN